jgi:threonine/homoserine/homoserine lactone efflux protein
MQIHPLLEGIGLGFLIAAPVGPIGLLCIRRTLAQGRIVGLMTGLGAAAADALYAAVAAFGLTSVSQFLIHQQALVRLTGGLFLCYLGLRTLLAQPQQVANNGFSQSSFAALVSTFLLTLTNPLTIISFAAVLAGLGIVAQNHEYLSATWLVAGVFLGSAFWWFLLSGGVSLFRSRFNEKALKWINRITGFLLLLFGVGAIVAAA